MLKRWKPFHGQLKLFSDLLSNPRGVFVVPGAVKTKKNNKCQNVCKKIEIFMKKIAKVVNNSIASIETMR